MFQDGSMKTISSASRHTRLLDWACTQEWQRHRIFLSPQHQGAKPNLKVYSARMHWRVLMGIEPRNSSIWDAVWMDPGAITGVSSPEENAPYLPLRLSPAPSNWSWLTQIRNGLTGNHDKTNDTLGLSKENPRAHHWPQLPIAELRNVITGCHRFPLNNFKYFLTLFSKFFSSFPHGTCSLSVSRWYLALDEIYHPLRAAIPNNSTRGMRPVRGEQDSRSKTGFSPSMIPYSKGLIPGPPLVTHL